MNKKKLFSIVLIASILITLFSLKGDSNYLQEKEADNIWSQLLPTLNEIIRKGDYLVYNNEIEINESPAESHKWKTFIERFSYHVGIINLKNTPKMRKTFTLQTQFRDFKNKTSIEFTISDDTTNEVIERRIFISKRIIWTCTVPVILALLLSFYTGRPLLGLSVSALIGSALINSNSVFIGLWQLIVHYIPEGLFGRNGMNFKLILFITLMHFIVSALSFTGGEGKTKKTLTR
ncbi:MAG: hypothetical protein JXA66_05655, partial [Oligoflexia bacterium]|nr:hypothetical protein [Oligoflexia bacterium]